MGNAAQFAIEIDRELAQVFDSWREAVIFIAREALADIVSLTPVDTGRAKAHWYVGIGGDTPEIITTETDRSGAVSIARGEQVLARYRVIDGLPSVTIYNDLPYIRALENGSSRLQAPAGMVGITAARYQAGL